MGAGAGLRAGSSFRGMAGVRVSGCSVCSESTWSGVRCWSDLWRKKPVNRLDSFLGGGRAGSSSRGMSITGRGLASVRRFGGAVSTTRMWGFSSSGSSSYLGRLRCFSISAPAVSRRDTITSTTSRAVNTMIEATLENTFTEPSARAPEIAPPEVNAVPVVQKVFSTPAEEGNSTLHSTMWHRAPSSTGTSRVQMTRNCTGRPWWNSRISAASRKAGAASQ